jgi:hypothetical protein
MSFNGKYKLRAYRLERTTKQGVSGRPMGNNLTGYPNEWVKNTELRRFPQL